MKLVSFKKGLYSSIGAVLSSDNPKRVNDNFQIVDLHALYAYVAYKEGKPQPRKLANTLLPTVMEEFIATGEEGIHRAKKIIEEWNNESFFSLKGIDGEPLVYERKEVQLQAPVNKPDKIICLSHNYKDFIEETGLPIPEDPRIFSKFSNTLCGPEDNIIYPQMTEELGYEVELAFIIGKKGRFITEEKAYDHIVGYTVFNDVSASDLTSKDKISLLRGKTFDNFAPIGPWIVTKDEIDDCHNLNVECRVNGEVLQKSSTAQLIFNIPQLVSFISQIFMLKPGDIVATGTPGGLAKHRNPKTFMKVGDLCEVEVENIGILSNDVVKETT